jgi:kumamolisin
MAVTIRTISRRARDLAPASALVAAFAGCQIDDPTGASATVGDTTTAAPRPTTGEPAPGGTTTGLPGEPTSGSGSDSASSATATTGNIPGDLPGDTTGDLGPADCELDPEHPLCKLPPEEHEPTDEPDGVPEPKPDVYDDLGPADPNAGVRSLLGFPTRDRAALEQRVQQLYDPNSPTFRQYLTPDAWMAAHAPPVDDVELVKSWLLTEGFTINWTASNRMLVHFSGTAAQFNEVFATELHVCMRKNPQVGEPPFPVYCALTGTTVPKFVADRSTGVLTADLPAEQGMLTNESGDVFSDPPGSDAYSPRQIAGAYDLGPLYDAGFTGEGATLGVIAAGTYNATDLKIFWKSFGIERELPTRVKLLEPVHERILETTLDVQWSTSIAPGAAVRVYEGPDARNTSLLFLWNEAIARNEVDVITNSFAHREDSEPDNLRHQYDESALMGAALGITLVSAGGNTARPDTPSGSPYVTSTGGTRLKADADGKVKSERAWSYSGSGDTKTFPVPYWQQAEAGGQTRAVSDVALNASPATPYWVREYGEWQYYGGTSFASPTFAAIVAVIDGKRKAEGKPRLGFLNATMYLDPAVRATFRDITDGETDMYQAGPGWDYLTGLGAPNAAALADALP